MTSNHFTVIGWLNELPAERRAGLTSGATVKLLCDDDSSGEHFFLDVFVFHRIHKEMVAMVTKRIRVTGSFRCKDGRRYLRGDKVELA